jgi:predicted O-methyltransferase YrrM
MATECEVLDFLTALVVMLKPSHIVETGCYHGHGTVAIVKGIIRNGFGTISTCDLGAQEMTLTHELLTAVPDVPFMSVEIRQCSGIELIARQTEIDFAN